MTRLNRKIQNKIQVNSIIQKSLRRNGNTGQDFAPLVRKIGGLDSVPAPNPAAGERDKLELIYFVCKSSRKKIPSVRLINISLSLIT